MIGRRQLGAAAFAAALVGTQARAQNNAIRFIVGFAPGGTSDVTARVVGEALAQSLGQTVLVENRPGAQGGIAIDAVVRAKPDGMTVLISPPEVLYMQGLDSNAPLDIEKSLTPVTMLSSQPIVVAVNPQTGWKSIDEMMVAGRQMPDGLTYATPGPGGTNNIIAAMMFRRAGVKYLNIPYKGGGQAVQDLLSGVVPVGVLGSAPLMPHVKTGKVTLLAVTSKKRSAMIPDVPASGRSGLTPTSTCRNGSRPSCRPARRRPSSSVCRPASARRWPIPRSGRSWRSPRWSRSAAPPRISRAGSAAKARPGSAPRGSTASAGPDLLGSCHWMASFQLAHDMRRARCAQSLGVTQDAAAVVDPHDAIADDLN